MSERILTSDQAPSEAVDAAAATAFAGTPRRDLDRERILLDLLQGAERAARVGAFVDDCDRPDGITWSDNLYRIFGLEPGAPPPREHALDAFPPASAAVLRDALRRMKLDAQPLEIELPLLGAPGRAQWVRLYVVPHFRDGRCVEISGAVQDVSDRKRLELEVTTAAESERGRIGADLHDDLGQVLTGLGMQVAALKRAAQRGASAEAQLESLLQIEHTVNSARESCRRLARSHVAPMSAGALGGMLEQLALDVPDPVKCHVRVDPLPDGTPATFAQELYRIAQESVANAIRHSRCRTLHVEVFVTAQRVILCVEDDGVGFDASRATPGLGLVSLRNRAARIGGSLQFGPGEAGGSRVTVAAARGMPADAGEPPPAEARYGVLRLTWMPEYACGEPTLDHQHRELFEHANRLIDAAAGPLPDAVLVRHAFQRLLDHVVLHFRTEEGLLQDRRYSHATEHAVAHARLVERAAVLKAAVDAGRAEFGSLVDFLANEVVVGHLLAADRRFYPLFAPARDGTDSVTF